MPSQICSKMTFNEMLLPGYRQRVSRATEQRQKEVEVGREVYGADLEGGAEGLTLENSLTDCVLCVSYYHHAAL